jgi:hypothetical protein
VGIYGLARGAQAAAQEDGLMKQNALQAPPVTPGRTKEHKTTQSRDRAENASFDSYAVTEQQASIFDVEPPPAEVSSTITFPDEIIPTSDKVQFEPPTWSASLEQYLAGWT